MQHLLSNDVSTLTTIFFYTVATILGFCGMLTRKLDWQKIACYGALLGFLFQTATLLFGFHASFSSGLPGGAYLQILAWFVGIAGIFLWLKLKLPTPLLFATPFCLILFVMSLPYLAHAIQMPQQIASSFYFLHIATLYISLALISIAFIASCLFLLSERTIKKKRKFKGLLQDTPSLHILDKINHICLLSAFPLYTVGMVTGFLRSKPTFGATFSGDPKIIVSIIIWGLLAILFHNRLAKNWAGKKPAYCMVCIFLLSLFSLLVINTLMDSHHTFLR